MTAPAFDTTNFNHRFSNKLLHVFTGKLLPVFFLAIIMVLYSRKLDYHDYGQFQTVWIYTNIISVIISFGLPSILLSTNFNYFAGFLKANRRIISFLYALGAVITFSIFYFTTYNFSSNTKLLLAAFILLQYACTMADTLLIKNNLDKIYLWVNFVYTLLFFAIHLYFFYQNFVLNQLIFCIICLSLLKAAGIFLLPKKNTLTPSAKAPDNFVANWLFIGFNEIAGIIARWLDKIFLLYLLSPAEFAVFFNGAFEIPLFAILISTMEYIMLANISSDISNKQAAQDIFKESFKILSLIAFPLFFFLLAMHAEAFAIIFKNKYNASVPVFLISIFIIPIRITHYGVILQCYGQSKKIAYGSLMDIGFSLMLMLILYPIMGTTGVALAIVVSTYLQAGYYLWQSAQLMKVRTGALVPVVFLVKLLLALAPVYGLLYYAKDYFSGVTSLIAMFAITGVIILTGLIFYWNSYNRHQLPSGNSGLH